MLVRPVTNLNSPRELISYLGAGTVALGFFAGHHGS